MAIPDFQSIMLPLLKVAGDQYEHSMGDVTRTLADEFDLTERERRELIPSGRQEAFYNRVGWARTYLKAAGLLQSTRRGYIQITERGLDVLKQNPPRINVSFLRQYPEFVEFQTPKRRSGDAADEEPAGSQTPEEDMEAAYQAIQQGLATELLQAVKSQSPEFFERLVIDLLVKMGYGGTRRDAGEAIGRSGDGGIDGIIKEDRLGLDIVYIQAKRWTESTVSRPEIQKFAGALAGQRATKGIFITTSSFTSEAQDYVSRIGSKIVLIDGDMLAQLMMDYGIGVTTIASYELKRIDTDYFSEE